MMKKLLLLGGSAQQVIAIKTARRLGYRTVLCDYLPDNPGQYEADVFYQVSTTDKQAVLAVAERESIDGIIAYSSDPAAPTAAYVAEKLGLPGIPYTTAKSFCEKNLFRRFLKNNHFSVPGCVGIMKDTATDAISVLRLPIIVKPTDSSGSKGVTVIHEKSQFEKAKEYALTKSRNGLVIAEEFIERDHSDVIEAEIFVVDGRVAVWGLINSIRDPYTNPLLPAAYSYPLNLSQSRIDIVKREIDRLVRCAGIRYGAMNIEMIITKDDLLYFLDAGPRNGGNMLPEFIGYIAQADIVAATIHAAMGEYGKIQELHLDGHENGYWGLCVLHAASEGCFTGVSYSDAAKAFLFREHFFVWEGDRIRPFIVCNDAAGLAFFHFQKETDSKEILSDFTGKHIRVLVDESMDTVDDTLVQSEHITREGG